MSRWIFPVLSVDGSTARQGAAMARMLQRVPGPVALIAGIPLPTVNVPVCLSANLRDIRRCATPRSPGRTEATCSFANGPQRARRGTCWWT